MKYISLVILIFAILFNLILYYPETQITLDPNDNIFQFALVRRTNDIWTRSHCPLSLSCPPNLIDHWVPNWAEGYPLPYYYSHLPQIFIVASYNLFIHPIFSIFHFPFSIFQYYTWIKYLLLSFFPLPVFLAFRVIGINPILASLGALFSTHLSTDGLYGLDPPSYLWRGYGLTSQLYSVFFIPLAIAFTYKALQNTFNFTAGDTRGRAPDSAEEGALAGGINARQDPLIKIKKSHTFWAILFTTLSIAGHLGIGMILLLTLPIFIFQDLKRYHLKLRLKKLILIVGVSIFILSYWIIPAFIHNKYHLISFWDPIWKFNSWGYYEVIRQFFSGEIFDWKRLPILTIVITIGFFTTILNRKYFTFAFVFVFWMLLYFGRATWGGLIDLIPGMKDFHQSRFIVGVHMTSLFLIPFGINYLIQLLEKVINFITNLRTFNFTAGDTRGRAPDSAEEGALAGGINARQDPQVKIKHLPLYISISILIITIIFLTFKQTIDYASLNNKWISEANTAYYYQEKDFDNLIKALQELPPGRVYAGRPGNWGRSFRYSSTQMYLALSQRSINISQFLPESWSPNSDNEQMFDERISDDYNLYNIRYIVAPADFTPPDQAKLLKQIGPYYLYEMPTSSYFNIVSSDLLVRAQKENYVNIVHVWQKSHTRAWNSYPLITLENITPPSNITRSVVMKDLVTYEENNQDFNIFANYPFTFPEATISGKITDQTIEKPASQESYKSIVDVPQNCNNCYSLFKMTYHPGWKAKIDGQDNPIYSIFPFMMALPTSPGQHIVEFIYQPSRLKLIILFLEFLVLIGYVFIKKVKYKSK